MTPARHGLALLGLVVAGAAQTTRPAEPPALPLEGLVLDLGDEPVPLADVWVVDENHRHLVLARTRTDGAGVFRIGRVQVQDYWLVHATADGKAVGTSWVQPSQHRPLLRLHDAASLTGTLRDDGGKPVAGAAVRAALDGPGSLSVAPADTTTDAAGRFTLAKVPLGRVVCRAVVPDVGLATTRVFLDGDREIGLAPEGGPTTSLEIQARVPAELLSLIRVELRESGGALPAPWASPRLDGEGRCRIDRLPDRAYVAWLRAGRRRFVPHDAHLQAGKGPHRVEFTPFTLPEPLVVPATLRGPGGEPLAGVRLVLGNEDPARPEVEAVTDAQGQVRFAAQFAPGDLAHARSLDDAWVLHQDRPQGRKRPGKLRPLDWHEWTVAPEATLDLRAVAACSLAGRVLRADGVPARNVEVRLYAQDQRFGSTWTDADGHYRFERLHHRDATVHVEVTSRHGAALGEPLALATPGTRLTVPDLQLAPPAVVEGVVRDGAGRPLPGAQVWLRAGRDPAEEEVRTDREGRFRFATVPVGRASVRFQGRGSRAASVPPFEVEAGKTVRLQLDAGDG